MNDRLERFGGGRNAGVWLGLMGALLVSACADDDLIDERQRNTVGSGGLFDAGLGDSEGASCPESPPKSGENCPFSEENQTRCTFTVGVCESEGQSYDLTVDYCCSRGTVWDTCGANTTPCDNPPPPPDPPPPPAPDAGPRPDAAPDAAPDA
jgi:hypothetical protein